MAILTPEQEGLEGAYRAHFPGLMRVAFLMTGSNPTAEDVVHDVFVRCAPRLATLDDPASYLRVAVVNACRRHHGNQARTTPLVHDDRVERAAEGDRLDLRDALAALDPRKRAAVVLRYYGDLSHDQVAAALGCRPATARSLVRRGLAELKGVLDDRG